MTTNMTHRLYARDALAGVGVSALPRQDGIRMRSIDSDSPLGARDYVACLKDGIATDRDCARSGST
jgi:hypothetical protein